MFAFTVIVMVAAPVLPLVGNILHQLSARVLMACAVHAVDALKDIVIVPPSVGMTGFVSVPAVNSILFSGCGVGVGSVFSGSPLSHEKVVFIYWLGKIQ